jgi:hypothetical protein
MKSSRCGNMHGRHSVVRDGRNYLAAQKEATPKQDHIAAGEP